MIIHQEQRLYTTREAAAMLDISVQRVRALVHAGELATAGIPGRSILITEEAVLGATANRGHQGRVFTPSNALAALTMLSGLQTGWINAQQRYSIRQTLLGCDVDKLMRLTRKRGIVHRYWASATMLERMRADHRLRPSGAYPQAAKHLGLAPNGTFEAYMDAGLLTELKDRYYLSNEDTQPNVRLHAVVGLRGDGPMPLGVCALDLAESMDIRERSAGRQCLFNMLSRFKEPTR